MCVVSGHKLACVIPSPERNEGEESRSAYPSGGLRARFLATLGMTGLAGFQHPARWLAFNLRPLTLDFRLST
jgi:hypothetical protein